MNFELITLAGNKVNEKVYEVILPTVDGEISVFPDHEPLVSVAATGVIAVRRDKNHSDEQLEYFAITGGIIEIANNHVRVLVESGDANRRWVTVGVSHNVIEASFLAMDCASASRAAAASGVLAATPP